MIRIYDKETGWRDANSIAEYPRTIPLADIRTHNKAAGKHFFDKDTMRFFGSRIISKEAHLQHRTGKYLFITSEKDYTGTIRNYSIRAYNPITGDITKSGDTLATLEAAKRSLQQEIND